MAFTTAITITSTATSTSATTTCSSLNNKDDDITKKRLRGEMLLGWKHSSSSFSSQTVASCVSDDGDSIGISMNAPQALPPPPPIRKTSGRQIRFDQMKTSYQNSSKAASTVLDLEQQTTASEKQSSLSPLTSLQRSLSIKSLNDSLSDLGRAISLSDIWKGLAGEVEPDDDDRRFHPILYEERFVYDQSKEYERLKFTMQDVQSMIVEDDCAFRRIQQSLRHRKCITNLYLQEMMPCYVRHFKDARIRKEERKLAAAAKLPPLRPCDNPSGLNAAA